MEFFTYTKLDNHKLSPWYFAVHWTVIALQQKVADLEAAGMDPTYDMRQLEQLQDLEQFLKMSWDQWMDNIGTRLTAQEAK
jgi:hypothetical protein